MDAAPSPLQELADAARTARSLSTSAWFSLPDGRVMIAYFCRHQGLPGRTGLWRTAHGARKNVHSWSPELTVDDLETAFGLIAARHPGAILRPDTILISIEKGKATASRLVPVAERAWHEVYGLPIPSVDDLAGRRKPVNEARRSAASATVARREPAGAGPTDFAGFLDRLKQAADPSRLARALDMLQADRFRLFARVDVDQLVGVVKSQSDESLVDSCRLAADGSYACCTQNLNVCGGLRGSPCKHLLVLILGLTQAGELEPGTAHDWTQSSRGRKPALDKDAMTATLLRFKGAEAGEVNWRPTETLPEDFYSI